MRLYEVLEQNAEKAAVFSYGRFNPPTIGHKKLIDAGKMLAQSLDADFFVFPTRTHDRERNPLDFNTKLKFLKAFFPGIRFIETTGQLFEVLLWLSKQNYTKVNMIVGSDRIKEFDRTIKNYIPAYNPNVEKGKAINFEKFNTVDAGQRDPDSDGAPGASGTKARELARTGQEVDFVNLVAPGEDENMKKELYRQVRRGLGVQ